MSSIIAEGFINRKSVGPIFVRERRITAGKPFYMIKFRTYYLPDDLELKQIGKKKTDYINNLKNTYTGLFLRKYYLDELPQLFSIIKGEMSFVGPRPYPEENYYALLKTGVHSKRLLKGGLCFPIQALKGKWDEHPDRLEYDELVVTKYLERSAFGVLLLDLKIIFSTLIVVIRGGGF